MTLPPSSSEQRGTPHDDSPRPPLWSVPYLTATLAGIGGTIKTCPDDFEVEEIPAYEPSGDGAHLFLWIEKRGVAAGDLIKHLGRVLGVADGEIGMAGLKDRDAVTRQFVSVPRSVAERVPTIDTPAIRVIASRPHGNKLRTGHLAGNRFRITVRDVVSDATERAAAIRDVILAVGLPNFFGPQRFGRDDETARVGLELLRGEVEAPPGAYSRQRFLRKLALSAGQAVLYNHYLARRMADGLLPTVLDGDVMFKQSGGIFYVTDQPAEQTRFDRRETVHAGPLFGKKMFAARSAAATREAAVLDEFAIPLARLRVFGRLLAGTRRQNLIYCDDLTIHPTLTGLEFQFSLPPGCYATVLLSEFMKKSIQPVSDQP
jgi:tRNA pseudouridine13 synthase